MTTEKKKRTQYNWKFKENESEEFYEWFNNQDNIVNSLRSILYHVIELYGNENILDPATQKEMVKDALILESLRDKDVISVNHEMIFGESKTEIKSIQHETDNEKNNNNFPVTSGEKKEINGINNDEVLKKIFPENNETDSKVVLNKSKIKYGDINKDLI